MVDSGFVGCPPPVRPSQGSGLSHRARDLPPAGVVEAREGSP